MVSFVSLEDPINAFLGKSEEDSDHDVGSNGEIVMTVPMMETMGRRKASDTIVLFFGDTARRNPLVTGPWTIVLIAHNDHEQIDQDNQEISSDHSTKRQKMGYHIPYHVHRCILFHVSSYFKSLFSTQIETVEQRNSTSTIHLHPKALQAFPIFLDYLYNSEEGRLSFCRKHAVALRHLAIYFGVDSIF
jgi:hypothetical protein